MEHRYGRHGPRAWLRQRQRRYGRPSRLPVPVEPQPTIVRVHVPINAERIIFIIMQGTPDQDDFNQQVASIPYGQQVSTDYLNPSPPATVVTEEKGVTQEGEDTSKKRDIVDDNTPMAQIQKFAERQAGIDIDEIIELCDEGETVVIQWHSIAKRNKGLIRDLIWNTIYRSSSPGNQAKDELANAYQTRHKAALDEGLKHYHLEAVTNPHIARIRETAMQDRVDFPSNMRGAYRIHQRDLGVIRVMGELGIDLESAIDRIAEVSILADEYEKYFSTPRKVVNWPDDMASFRERNA